MRIFTLMENTACAPEYACEHGLSFCIETGGRKLLFDMGQSDLFVKNACALGIDLSEVDMAFVSHGHYDHGGGLAAFLEINDHAPVYVHEKAFAPHFSRKPEGIKDIGLDTALAENPRLRRVSGVTQIDRCLTLFSDITGKDCVPTGNRTLYERENGQFVPDRFTHEQSLIVREGDTAVLFTGCAHRGVINICARAKELLGRDPDVVIGGMHLFSPSTGKSEPDENIRVVAARLAETESRYYTCHCTGPHAYDVLRETLGERIAFLPAGSMIEV
ncbi:MBL fold metallo-hydrolase [Candidatus Agathobaculum pullicola]|uniref:MBL fold metallo-hydrolase n=1 Tax=Candidatus Agathobaculum pullicola TaxID=2838426 RepID=UPI003F921A3A